jgi:hypothetical protein
LKLNQDESPSNFAFSFNLRHYSVERVIDFAEMVEEDLLEMGLPLLQRRRFRLAAGLAEAGRCRLTPGWPRVHPGLTPA